MERHAASVVVPCSGGRHHGSRSYNLINVEVPESALSVYSDAVVRKALASVTFRPAPIKEQLSLLPFRFGDLAGFEVVQVMPTGTVVLADKADDKSTDRPIMIVSVGRGGPADASDRSRLARDLVATAPVRDLSDKIGRTDAN